MTLETGSNDEAAPRAFRVVLVMPAEISTV